MKKLLPIAFLLISWNINAQQPPTACFTGDSMSQCQVSFTDLSLGNPTSWDWLFTGGTPPSTMVQNPAGIMWITPGTYTVELTVSNAFGFDIETKVGVIVSTTNTCFYDTTIGTPCTLITGVGNSVIVDEPISVYPNPTTGIFTVQGATGEIEVYDLFGRLVLETPKKEIDMSSFSKGLYFVKAGETTLKLILQ